MNRYLIKLTPLDTFFFSQENKYRKKFKKDKDDNKYEADYYQKSSYFPQQTTLFGMLRYYVLLKNEQIPITKKKLAKELIGKQSFDVGRKNPKFGTIDNISSVFIIDKDGKFYFKNPKDLIVNKDSKIEPLIKTNANFKSNTSSNMVFFENYVEKEGLDSFLIHSDTEILPFEFDKKDATNGVFIKKEKVGIKKNKKGETDDKAFYKQVFYSLNKDYSFGIIAELDKMEEHTGFVSMGAEKSPFKISFEKYSGELKNEITLDNCNNPKIVLLSDAYLLDYNKEDFQFAISETKSFRFLKTEVKEGNKYYSSDPLKKKEIKRSRKLSLLEKGSVFFFENESQMNKFSKKLNKESNFKQIGYNQHKTII